MAHQCIAARPPHARSVWLFALKGCLSTAGGTQLSCVRCAKQSASPSLPTHWGSLVPERGLEPPLPCENQLLKLARLPIPPLGHKRGKTRHFDCARRIGLCQRAAPPVILQVIPPSNSADGERQDAALPLAAVARAANAPGRCRIGEVPRKGSLTRVGLQLYSRGTNRAQCHKDCNELRAATAGAAPRRKGAPPCADASPRNGRRWKTL